MQRGLPHNQQVTYHMDPAEFAAEVVLVSAFGVLSPGPLFFANIIYGGKMGLSIF